MMAGGHTLGAISVNEWMKEHGEEYRKIIAEFGRCERERAFEAARLAGYGRRQQEGPVSESKEEALPSLPVQEFYDLKELGAAMGVSPDTARRWIRQENIPTVPRTPRQGSRIRVRYESIVSAFPDLIGDYLHS